MRTSPGILICLFLLVSFYFWQGCKQEQPANPGSGTENIKEQKKNLLKANRFLVRKDTELINSYAERRGWKLSRTENGLYYMIMETGHGPKPEEGTRVTMHYSISLLDGTLCYRSDSSNPKKFVVGKSKVESGLDTGIRMLKEGARARFILPPHLAYGLLGDEGKIPPRSVIVYEIELIKVSDH